MSRSADAIAGALVRRRSRAAWAIALAVLLLPAGTALAAKRADLVAKAGPAPSKLAPGDGLVASDVTRNKGRRKARRSKTGYYLSRDQERGGGDLVLGKRGVKRLKPGKRSRGRRQLSIPVGIASGDYHLLACADAKRRVRERTERNNCRASEAVQILSVPAPTTPVPGPGPGPTTAIPTTPTPPAPPAPPAMTSHQLIEEALANGEIDEETALTYEVFAEFDDPRLPPRFRGAPLGVTDTDTLDRVAEQWSELSASARSVLDPFFVPPFNRDSWYEPESSARSGARAGTAPSSSLSAPGEDLCTHTAPDLQGWAYRGAAGGKARVWWEKGRASDRAKAQIVASELDQRIWSRVTTLFREPLPDDRGYSGAMTCRGGNDALDIAIAPSTSPGRVVPYPMFGIGFCTVPKAGFMLLSRKLAGKDLLETLAHELAHATHLAYIGNRCNDEGWDWLTEATATWTVDFAYPALDEEQDWAYWFLQEPELPLETFEIPTTVGATPRQYEAYLFFFFLARMEVPQRIGDIWEATEYRSDGALPAIEAVLGNTILGGFEVAWKEFALYNLNREPVDHYRRWDGLAHQAKVEHGGTLSAPQHEPIPIEVPHLAATYRSFSFADDVKRIEFENTLAGKPGASVQALIQIGTGADTSYRTADWSNDSKVVVCRDPDDPAAEDVTELTLVFANSIHADTSHVLRSAPTLATDTACFPRYWSGTYQEITTSVTGDYRERWRLNFTLQLSSHVGSDSSAGYATYTLRDGRARYTSSGSYRFGDEDECSYIGGGNARGPVTDGFMELLTQHPLTGAPDQYRVQSVDAAAAGGSDRIDCIGVEPYEVPVDERTGFSSDLGDWDSESDTITGSDSGAASSGDFEWEQDWTLTSSSEAPP